MARLLTGLALHALLREVQRDPEGLVLRSLPPPIRRLLRRHLKWPANALVDLIASTLLPIGQRRSLRAIRGEEHSVGEGLVVEVFRTHAPAGAPLLLFVHGGIWTLGNRYQYRGIGQRAAVEGMVGVVLGYRTWPEANASEQASSVRAALAFVREHAARWGADEKRVYLSGQSSGANVSALALMEGGGVSCAGLIGSARGPPPSAAPPPHLPLFQLCDTRALCTCSGWLLRRQRALRIRIEAWGRASLDVGGGVRTVPRPLAHTAASPAPSSAGV